MMITKNLRIFINTYLSSRPIKLKGKRWKLNTRRMGNMKIVYKVLNKKPENGLKCENNLKWILKVCDTTILMAHKCELANGSLIKLGKSDRVSGPIQRLLGPQI